MQIGWNMVIETTNGIVGLWTCWRGNSIKLFYPLNVNISDNFNLAFYTIMTVFLPSLLIFIFGRHSIKGLIQEFNLYDKKRFLIAAFCWSLMLIASVRAYQLGNVTIVAPILTLTSILNTIYEYLIVKNKSKFLQKVVASIMIITGVLLIRL